MRSITHATEASIAKKPALIADFLEKSVRKECFHKNMSRKETILPDEVIQKEGQKGSFSQIEQAKERPHKNPPNCLLFYLYCLANIRKTLRKSAPILDKNRFAKKLIRKKENTPPTVHIERPTMVKKGLGLEKTPKMMYSVCHEAVGGRGNDPREDTESCSAMLLHKQTQRGRGNDPREDTERTASYRLKSDD